MTTQHVKAEPEDLVFNPNQQSAAKLQGYIVMEAEDHGKKYIMFKPNNLSSTLGWTERFVEHFNNNHIAAVSDSPVGIIVVVNQKVFDVGAEFLKTLFIFAIITDQTTKRYVDLNIDVSGDVVQDHINALMSREVTDEVYTQFSHQLNILGFKLVHRGRWIHF